MAVELCRRLRSRSREKRSGCLAEFDRDSRRLLIDPVHDVSRNHLISAMAVQDQKAAKSMVDETLRSFEVNTLYRIRRQRDGSRKGHVIWRNAGQQYWSYQHVGFLRDQFGTLYPSQIIGSDRKLWPVLFNRRDRNHDHVAPAQQVLNLRPRHVREIVLDLLLVPERIRLSLDQSRENCQRD